MYINNNHSRHFSCASGDTTNNIMLTSSNNPFPICFSFSSILLLRLSLFFIHIFFISKSGLISLISRL